MLRACLSAIARPIIIKVKSEVDVEDMEATIAALDLSYQPVQVQEQHRRSQSRQSVLLPAEEEEEKIAHGASAAGTADNHGVAVRALER